ncbi:MAG: DUF4296 domain-containing protein [Bacteroidota bacterium]
MADSAFVNLLTDLHLENARLAHDTSATKVSRRDSILTAHWTTEPELEATLRYYSTRPNEYLEIYDEVLSQINQRYQERRLDRYEDQVVPIEPLP